MGLRFKKQNHSLLFDNAFMCSIDEGREDQVNLNCSENDQQWRWAKEEGGVRAETWWASRRGSTDGRNAREWGRGGRGVRREGAGEGEG